MFNKLFLDKITHLLDIHAPITKLSIKQKKELEKPWLTKRILQSIKQKNIIYRKFIKSKETTSKEAILQKLNITKTLLTNLRESIRQIFTSHSLRNTKMIQRKHGTE